MAALTPTHGIEPWYAKRRWSTMCNVQSKLRLDSLNIVLSVRMCGFDLLVLAD